MPGLIDSHNHFLITALGWERVQLAAVTCIDELLDAIARRACETPPGEWILCASRWHETNLAERRMPTAEELDRAAPDHPLYLPRGGHVVVTNSLGLARAGITPDREDPDGGEFVSEWRDPCPRGSRCGRHAPSRRLPQCHSAPVPALLCHPQP